MDNQSEQVEAGLIDPETQNGVQSSVFRPDMMGMGENQNQTNSVPVARPTEVQHAEQVSPTPDHQNDQALDKNMDIEVIHGDL